jgi:hypothetical protein
MAYQVTACTAGRMCAGNFASDSVSERPDCTPAKQWLLKRRISDSAGLGDFMP